MVLVRFTLGFVLVLLSQPLVAKERRLSLVALGVEGYEAYKDVRSFLDVAVQETDDAEGLNCSILTPQPHTKAATQSWAPFDFYTKIRSEKEQETEAAAGRLGEPDVFFIGDNNNRNRVGNSHKWTRRVTDSFRGSLDFLQKKIDKKWFSFLLQFKRGKINYDGLIKVRTWPKEGECQVETRVCTSTYEEDGQTRCHPDAWNRRIMEVIAEANVSGALSDTFYRVTDEKKKSDVAAVFGLFQDLDKDGDEIGKPYREKVAPK